MRRSIAAMHAISPHALEVPMGMKLTQAQFDREAGYRFSLTVMGALHKKGLITQEEYRRIEPILAQKFSPVWAGYPDVIKDKCA
jgi:hypothetical protein